MPIRLMTLASGHLPIFLDADHLAAEIGEHPCVWTDAAAEEYGDAGLDWCRAFMPVPGSESSACRVWMCDFGLASFLAWAFGNR